MTKAEEYNNAETEIRAEAVNRLQEIVRLENQRADDYEMQARNSFLLYAASEGAVREVYKQLGEAELKIAGEIREKVDYVQKIIGLVA